jgi:hypothetical protein
MHQTASPTESLLQRSIKNLKAAPLRDRKNIWMWCVVASALVILLYIIVPTPYRSASVLLSIVASCWALAFYFHRRRADETRFAKELLTEFNQRYDSLNNHLQLACWRTAEFENDTKLSFIKYFNLCAEEWLFWSTGQIEEPVWRAWRNGMKQYAKDRRVMAIWDEEAKTDSYYGFDFRGVTSTS